MVKIVLSPLTASESSLQTPPHMLARKSASGAITILYHLYDLAMVVARQGRSAFSFFAALEIVRGHRGSGPA
jgi:hypothetical protein